MKTRTSFVIFTISLFMAFISCDDTNSEMIKSEQPDDIGNSINSSGEEKAIEAFNAFISNLNDKLGTRGVKAQIVQVKKYTSAAYRGNEYAATRSAENETPVYELVLDNQDNTKGFAVVAEFPTSSDVMAYAPIGSVTDTVFNKGLALFFREFACFTEALAQKQKRVTTRATDEYWQGYQEYSFVTVPGTYEYYRDMTKEEIEKYGAGYLKTGPVDYRATHGPLVSTKWEQNAPYNNKVPVFLNGTNKRVKVGCFAVAVAQLMSYHKKPSSYNWSLLTAAPTISVYDNVASDEVSRLMIDIATAGKTDFDAINNTGGTFSYDMAPAIRQMGYKVVKTYLDSENSGDSIYNNIMSNRPVLMSGATPNKGHIWVIDGIFTQERWFYSGVSITGTNIPARYMINRQRERSRLCHCNWGWGGLSNGWYYDYSPVYTDGLSYRYAYDKYIYTQIEPQ